MSGSSITKLTDLGNKAEADVALTVRKSGESLIQASSDSYTDHYVLRREVEGWKVDLGASQIQSAAATTKR